MVEWLLMTLEKENQSKKEKQPLIYYWLTAALAVDVVLSQAVYGPCKHIEDTVATGFHKLEKLSRTPFLNEGSRRGA